MEDLISAQVAASTHLQESEESLNDFIKGIVRTFGGSPIVEAALVQFKRSCIAYGRLQVTLENTLRNDQSNQEKEG